MQGEVCPCLSTHTQNAACTPPQLFLWGSGSDSCPSEESSHCSEKDVLSTLFRGPSLPLSLRGTVRPAKQKTLQTPDTGPTSHNEHGNNNTKTLLPNSNSKAVEQMHYGCIQFIFSNVYLFCILVCTSLYYVKDINRIKHKK